MLFNTAEHTYLGKTICKLDQEIPEFEVHSDS